MMNKLSRILFAMLIISALVAGCQRNYYSSKAKKSDCGCPNTKGQVGY